MKETVHRQLGSVVGTVFIVNLLGFSEAIARPVEPVGIPLQHVTAEDDDTDIDSLGIMIGINGAPPHLYLLDTGSDLFLGQFEAEIEGVEPLPGSKPTLYGYGDGTYGYWHQDIQFGQMSFYDPFSKVSVLNIPGKHTAGRISDWVYSQAHNGFSDSRTSVKPVGHVDGISFYADLDVRDRINSGMPSDHPPFFGTYGAGNFTRDKKYSAAPGSQTRTGYIVAANANIGANTTPGCAPCLNLHLNPNLRAQFTALMPWGKLEYDYSERTFTGSGANASNVHDGNFNYAISVPVGKKKRAVELTGPILFDTGTADFILVDADVALKKFKAKGYTLGEYERDIVDIKFHGFTDTLNDLEYDAVGIGRLSREEHDAAITIGLPFFHMNSVMFDLENRVTAYSPFFVTGNDFSTDLVNNGSFHLARVNDEVGSSGWIGIAGTLSGKGDFTLDKNANVRMTGTNTYTGHTFITDGSALHLAGAGSISQSAHIFNEGLFYIDQKGSYHSSWGIDRLTEDAVIRGISGSGNILLGPNRLILTDASGRIAGNITDRDNNGKSQGGGVVVLRGRLTIAGDNDYTGLTEVASGAELHVSGQLIGDISVYGKLIVNGEISGTVKVYNGGEVTGNGAVGNMNVLPGGSAVRMKTTAFD